MLKQSRKIMSLSLFAIVLAGVLIFSAVYAENTTPDTTPFITIDPVGNHTIDEVFFINGTTNLPANNEPLLLQIETTNFNPGGSRDHFSVQTSLFNLGKMVSIPGPVMQQHLSGRRSGQDRSRFPSLMLNQVNILWMSSRLAPPELPHSGNYFLSSPPEAPTLPPTVPVAAFGYYGNRTTEPYNMVPLAVQFEDTSTNSPTAWLWTFGDGSTSSLS